MQKFTIQRIHDRRKVADENSKTLAGMIGATVYTGFHDHHKFVKDNCLIM